MAKTPKKTVRRVLAGLAAIAVILGTAWFAIDAIDERQKAKLADAYVQEIISRLGLVTTQDFHQRLDTVRTFINDNSVHKIDAEFWANHGNPASFAAGVLAHAKGDAHKPIHMECSTRTNLMRRIFEALGYQTRVVAIFNSRTNLHSHTFLEVMNPETKRWETQDADYDIYWRDESSGLRISLADEAESIDGIEPCGRNDCGWGHASWEGIRVEKLKPYLEIISLTDKGRDLRYALYTSRADLDRTYRKERKRGSFCEVEAKRCKQGFFDIRTYSSYAPGLPR